MTRCVLLAFTIVLAACGGQTDSGTDAAVDIPPTENTPAVSEQAPPADESPTTPTAATVPAPTVEQPDLPRPDIPEPELPEVELPAPDLPDPVFPDLAAIQLPNLDLPGVGIGESDEVTVFTIDATVLFDFDQSTLRADAIETLEAIARAIEDNGLTGPIQVAGHTDAIGTVSYNVALSEARAASVVEFLSSTDELADRDFSAVGYGESRPVAPNTRPDGSDDPDGRQLNRRVEIAVG